VTERVYTYTENPEWEVNVWHMCEEDVLGCGMDRLAVVVYVVSVPCCLLWLLLLLFLCCYL